MGTGTSKARSQSPTRSDLQGSALGTRRGTTDPILLPSAADSLLANGFEGHVKVLQVKAADSLARCQGAGPGCPRVGRPVGPAGGGRRGRAEGRQPAVHPADGGLRRHASTAGPDELTFRRYQRFGAGGAKLIWGEAAAVVEEGRANPRQLCHRRRRPPPACERMLRELPAGPPRGVRQRRRPGRRPATDALRPLQLPPAAARLPRPASSTRAPSSTEPPAEPVDATIRCSTTTISTGCRPLRRRGQAGVRDRLSVRRHQAVPPLPAERTAGGQDPAGPVRRQPGEPHPAGPRHHRRASAPRCRAW